MELLFVGIGVISITLANLAQVSLKHLDSFVEFDNNIFQKEKKPNLINKVLTTNTLEHFACALTPSRSFSLLPLAIPVNLVILELPLKEVSQLILIKFKSGGWKKVTRDLKVDTFRALSFVALGIST